MKHSRLIGFIIVLTWLALAPREAGACVCVELPDSCARVSEADAVFEATVSWIETRVREDQPHPQYLFTERVVHLRDVRAWRGQAAEIIVTGMGGGDCGYEFRAGTRYMIEAYRGTGGQLSTGICSKTQPLMWAAGFRDYVESLSAPSRGGHIWGRIVTPPRYSAATDPFSGGTEPDPVDGAKVLLTGPAQRTVDVGPDGLFSVAALPPGEYTISVTLPPDRRDLKAVAPQPVRLDGPRACAEVSFVAYGLVRSGGAIAPRRSPAGISLVIHDMRRCRCGRGAGRVVIRQVSPTRSPRRRVAPPTRRAAGRPRR